MLDITVPDGFTLKDYLSDGNLQFSDGVKLALKARINDNLAMHISETPLSDDQAIAASESFLVPSDVFV